MVFSHALWDKLRTKEIITFFIRCSQDWDKQIKVCKGKERLLGGGGGELQRSIHSRQSSGITTGSIHCVRIP
jgi:hypothetical protein